MRNLTKENFIRRNWIKHWAGQWKLLNNSMLGYQYTKLLRDELGMGLEIAAFVSHKGYSVAYLDFEHYKKFGSFLAKNILNNTKQLKFWTTKLKNNTDKILNLIKKLKREMITGESFGEFAKSFYEYGVPHRVIKVGVDALPVDKLRDFLPELSNARVYSEPVYAETELFMERVAKQIALSTGYTRDYILYTTREEFSHYWEKGILPDKPELAQRFLGCFLLCRNGQSLLFSGRRSNIFEENIEKINLTSGDIKGFVAYPGKIRGIVKIVFNPSLYTNFKKGDILVTGMTRPEYVPFIKKSAAFVTDAGGLLSHAAITARELKKICIVGTKIATRVLKDGDLVEVDANKGIVRKLSN